MKPESRSIAVGCLILSTLTGCATLQKPAQPLPPPAAQAAAQITLKQAGLSHPQTVYVPAFYTSGNDNLLFIDGRQYRAPNGAANVMGYLPTATGYVVAVENVPTPLQLTDNLGYPMGKLQAGAKLELFAVNEKGKTEKEIASIDLRQYDQVFQSNSAFYVQRVTGSFREMPAAGDGSVPLYSFFGLNATGHRVNGPVNVLFATPAPDGGWYKLVPTSRGALGGYSGRFYHTKNGQILYSKSESFLYSDPEFIVHTPAMFINEPPVVDSVRTGRVLLFSANGNPLNSDVDYVFAALNLNHPNFDSQGFANTTAYGLAECVYLTQRFALFGTPENPKVVRQISTGSFGGTLYVGYQNLVTKDKVPVFRLMGGTMNVVRRFLGSNGGSVSTANRKVDAFTVITPADTILMGVSDNDFGNAYDVDLHGVIPKVYAEEFASTYGVTP